MFGQDDRRQPGAPIPDEARVPVSGADGWYILPFEHDEPSGDHRITIVREDGVEAHLTLPAFVQQGDELEEILRLVIRARERWRDLKGLGA